MKVSVALASYNGAAFIEQQLRSFSGQTRPPDEVVISDDVSSDSTLDVVERFARSAPFDVKIIRNSRNLGYVGNFERALAACAGDVIFLSDQDDVWGETKIARVLQEFADNPSAQVVTNDEFIVDQDLKPLGTTKLENLLAVGLTADSMMTGCCTAITSRWRELCLPFPDGIRGHDIWIGTVASLLGVRKFLPVPLQSYRRHGDNVTSSLLNSGPVTAGTMVRDGLGRDGSGNWPSEVLLLDALILRLKTPAARQFATGEGIERAIDRATARKAAVERRIDAVGMPKVVRPVVLARNWMSGDYAHFLGLKSLLKDVLR